MMEGESTVVSYICFHIGGMYVSIWRKKNRIYYKWQMCSGITPGRVLNGELYAHTLQKLIYLHLSTDCFMNERAFNVSIFMLGAVYWHSLCYNNNMSRLIDAQIDFLLTLSMQGWQQGGRVGANSGSLLLITIRRFITYILFISLSLNL